MQICLYFSQQKLTLFLKFFDTLRQIRDTSFGRPNFVSQNFGVCYFEKKTATKLTFIYEKKTLFKTEISGLNQLIFPHLPLHETKNIQ